MEKRTRYNAVVLSKERPHGLCGDMYLLVEKAVLGKPQVLLWVRLILGICVRARESLDGVTRTS